MSKNTNLFENILIRRPHDELIEHLDELLLRLSQVINNPLFQKNVNKDSLIRMIKALLTVLNEGETVILFKKL